MGESLKAWHSFWDTAASRRAAARLRALHGAGATAVALDRVLAARAARRREDYRFWLCVLCLLYGVRPRAH
ncbi:MAG: hypothetical protein QNJ30_19635 [Kiloniellales bacterium]|nr:hypothetical protein [Kiloniellales bacterium]